MCCDNGFSGLCGFRSCWTAAQESTLSNNRHKCAPRDGFVCTFRLHAHVETLLEATELAPVTIVLIDRTVPVAATRVAQPLSYAALEEALAALAADHAVMAAGSAILADDASFDALVDERSASRRRLVLQLLFTEIEKEFTVSSDLQISP